MKKKKENSNVSGLKIIPLGGLEQIGMNITAFQYEDRIIVVDCGLSFPADDMLGIDLVIPDVTYLKDNIDKVKGFVITHGHEDHIGALPYVLRDINVPIYATRLTMGIIENKLTEHNLMKKTKRKVACMNPVTYVIVNGAIIALIYTGAVQVNIGNLSQGEVVAIINYMNQILVELVKLANLIVTMTKALACAERVASVFDIGADAAYVGAQNQKLADKVDKSAPFLDFKHVSLTYQGAGAPTLQDMNFTVNRGDTVGIIGGTGSGKTSLVNLIPGFYPATEGEILLEGRDIRTMSDEELRGRIGVVPQKAVLFKGTIRSNLQWGKPDATEEEMWKALELAQASEVVDGKPGKLDATVAQNGKNFSGGQRQRLTIARALVRNPEILILDDSASALDYATDAKLRAAIRTLEDKTTTFIVSQRASTIRHADKIIVLDDGEIAGVGTHDELLKDCTVYQEIYYSQYPEQRGGVQ